MLHLPPVCDYDRRLLTGPLCGAECEWSARARVLFGCWQRCAGPGWAGWRRSRRPLEAGDLTTLFSLSPVAGSPAKIGYGDDPNHLCFHLVDHAKWEAVDKTASSPR